LLRPSPPCATASRANEDPGTGERDAYIGKLVVADRASRRGIGRALVAAADAWARDHDLRNLTLHASAYNVSARAFYADLGFAEEEVRLTRPIEPGPEAERDDDQR
jgi:GNAT superfamily N-acetyltransferase